MNAGFVGLEIPESELKLAEEDLEAVNEVDYIVIGALFQLGPSVFSSIYSHIISFP